MRRHLCHVNLSAYSAPPDTALQGTPEQRIRAFQKVLEAEGVPTTVRVPMGRDIAAACGQLRGLREPRTATA